MMNHTVYCISQVNVHVRTLLNKKTKFNQVWKSLIQSRILIKCTVQFTTSYKIENTILVHYIWTLHYSLGCWHFYLLVLQSFGRGQSLTYMYMCLYLPSLNLIGPSDLTYPTWGSLGGHFANRKTSLCPLLWMKSLTLCQLHDIHCSQQYLYLFNMNIMHTCSCSIRVLHLWW